MKKLDVRFSVVVLSLLFNLFVHVACELANEDGEDAALLTGSIASSSASSKIAQSASLNSLSLTSYYIYCVSFEEQPVVSVGNIDSDGSFAFEIPLGVPVGCFLNDVSSNQAVASFVIKDSSSGEEDSSLAVTGSMDLGVLSVDLEKGEVEIPKERIASRLDEQVGVSFDADTELHGQTYTMSCIETNNAEQDAACNQMVSNDGNSVYFRVLKATEDWEAVEGLGVWKSEADFNNCGAIDMTDAERTDIESDGVSFTRVTTASAYGSDTSLCPLRDSSRAAGRENLENYFALGKLEQHSGYRKMKVYDEFDYGSGCTRVDKTEIYFKPKGNGVFVGHFQTKEYWEEVNDGDCGSREESVRQMLVKFTKAN